MAHECCDYKASMDFSPSWARFLPSPLSCLADDIQCHQQDKKDIKRFPWTLLLPVADTGFPPVCDDLPRCLGLTSCFFLAWFPFLPSFLPSFLP